MLSAIFNRMKSARRRPTAPRRAARSQSPALESLEGKQLLTHLLMVGDARTVEGTGGTTPMQFTVYLMRGSSERVTVDYSTSDGSARAWEDYTPTSGKLTFEPWETQKTVTVPVIADGAYEPGPEESFYLSVSNAPGNCWIWQPSNVGLIIDDDAPKAQEFTISDAALVRQGDGAVQWLGFEVSLAAPSNETLTVRASTFGFTAQAGVDYGETSQVLTFAPGQTKQTLWVAVYGSSSSPWQELFWVGLSEASRPVARAWAFGYLNP